MNRNTTALVRVISLTAALMLMLSLAPALNAQPPVRKVGPKRTLKTLQDFDNRLLEIDRFLVAGDSKKAYREASRLLQRMTDTFISGPDVGRFLGLATVLRAIAAYHLGREDEALWHWHVAIQMFPEVSSYQMTAYGDAGPFLKNHPLPQEAQSEDAYRQVKDIQPPRKKRSPKPKIPAAKRGSGRISVIVQAVIGEDGRVREPRILKSQGELTVVCAALDALRKWEFSPAQKDGEPVAVYYTLTMNYSP